ncbi:MAG: 1-acyl-sn-glycerol-3-phosphate acyltransferase [Bacilli bacterium]|nr:1-acyl-sn-glycerol-3-phosphate acyltransferase [Bacilli bacterium]
MKYNNHYFGDVYLHNSKLKYPHVDKQHMVIYPKKYDYVYDKNFPYRLKDPWNKFLGFWLQRIILWIGAPGVKVMYGLKVKGKENIKKYFKLNGNRKAMISTCNHTVATDFIMISSTRHKTPIIPMWQEGAESKKGMMFRRTVGLVVPRDDMKGIAYSYREMREVLKEDKWLHIYPEAASWPLYPCLREFHKGAFTLAYDFDLPILPMGVRFREPKGLYRLFKKSACATISIGEPLLINKSLERSAAVEDLKERTFNATLHLLGIKDKEENQKVRNEIYNIIDDQVSKR